MALGFSARELRFSLSSANGWKAKADYSIARVVLDQAGPVTLRFFVNNTLLDSIRYEHDGRFTWEKPVPAFGLVAGGMNYLRIEADQSIQDAAGHPDLIYPYRRRIRQVSAGSDSHIDRGGVYSCWRLATGPAADRSAYARRFRAWSASCFRAFAALRILSLIVLTLCCAIHVARPGVLLALGGAGDCAFDFIARRHPFRQRFIRPATSAVGAEVRSSA